MDGLNQKDLRTFPVIAKPCKSCPFAGKELTRLTVERQCYLTENLIGNGQQLCHSVNNEAICRGGRDIQLKLLYALDCLPEPTDEAFDKAINEAMDKLMETYEGIVKLTNAEMQRIGWSTKQGREHLIKTYGHRSRSRKLLSHDQLVEFLDYLKSLPKKEA